MAIDFRTWKVLDQLRPVQWSFLLPHSSCKQRNFKNMLFFCLQLIFLLKPTQAEPVLFPSAHPTTEGIFMLKC
jgi:hypothetical protein